MNKLFKSSLSLVLALIVVFGLCTPVAQILPVASALEFSNFYTDSDIWLVDCNTHKTSSTIYLYGRADYISLKLKQTDNYSDIFYFRLYSDSKHTKEILSYSTEYSKVGTKYIDIPVSFDDIKSGTYYAETYVYKRCVNRPTGVWLPDGYVPREVDEETRRSYKVKITKKGTDIDDMNTVMYGFENTEKGPRIYWYSVPGATGYYVYRKSPKTGKYSKIKTVKDSGDKFTGYTDGTYKGENVTRYYKVVAYKGSLKTPSSLKSLKVVALKTPTVKAEMISDNRIKISWSKVKSKAQYTVFSRHNDSDTWKEIKTVKDKLYYVLDAKNYDNNDIYRFTVVANSSGIYSGYNTTGAAVRYLEYPALKACTYPETGGITVNWEAVNGADSYIVYRKQKSSADWVAIGEVSGNATNEYTDLTANNKDLYYYTVRSVRKGVNGSLDNTGIKATILSAPKLLGITENDGQSINVNWEKLPNDCKYIVMKKTTVGWEEIKTTSDNFYTHNLNSRISTETFTVKATRSGFTSDFDKVGVTYTAYPKVVITDTELNQDGFTLKWKKPVNAENSIVYKKVDDGEYTVLAELEGDSLVDASVEVGVKYTYKIAYKYNGEIVESAAIEQPLCINTDVVERDEAAYETISESSGYKIFTTKLKDFDPESQYRVYQFTENGLVRFNRVPNSQGEITVKSNTFSDEEQFAIVKITPQGDYTLITEPAFSVKFVSDYIPQTVASATIENGYPTIKWDFDSTKAADNVYIYRKAPDSKNVYRLVGVVPATQTTFVDESAKPNYVYDYQLRVENDGFITSGGPVAQVNYMGTPEVKLANDKGRVHIEWNEISRAEKYIVYKKLPTDENWTKLTTTEKLYFDDKNEVKYVGYQYMVRATDTNGNKSPDGVSEIWKYVPSVADFKAELSSKKTKLTWSAVSGADGYIIMYHDYSVAKGKWTEDKVLVKIKGGSKTSYTDKTLPADTVRTYYMCAYYDGFEGVETWWKRAGYLSVQPKITSLKSNDDGVVIKIGKISKIDRFIVYRKGPGDEKWKKIGTAYSRTFKDYNVKEGKKYSYTVRSVFDSTGYDIYSTRNETGWSITYNP